MITARMKAPVKNEDDIIFLDELAKEKNMSVETLKKLRIDKHIPKVKGIKRTAILGRYLPELFKNAS